MNKNILIVDDDVETSLKYKKWLEEEDEGFNLTLINDPELAELNFQPQNYDLVLIGFKMSVIWMDLVFTINYKKYQKGQKIHQKDLEYVL